MADFILPMIHLNGTGRSMLTEDYLKALKDAIRLRDSINGIEFHPRDYYPMGDEAFSDAKFARDEIRAKLDDIITYLEMHLAHVSREKVTT